MATFNLPRDKEKALAYLDYLLTWGSEGKGEHLKETRRKAREFLSCGRPDPRRLPK